jgi:hypothetical protein
VLLVFEGRFPMGCIRDDFRNPDWRIQVTTSSDQTTLVSRGTE